MARKARSAGKAVRLRRNLLSWYSRHKRALPWRSRPTPYRIWIAEIMLQQTRVQAVLPYYRRFLNRFPDIRALAAASEQEVLELWAGLGYYRRARNLHRAAVKIMAEAGGVFPVAHEEILGLPGVGRYTASAIQSIAYGMPQPVVDGNVMRVIRRCNGMAGAPAGYFWQEADAWLDRRHPAEFNQAMMELGALVCTPARPRCGICPLRGLCVTGSGARAPAPARRRARRQETVKMVLLVVESGGSVLLQRCSEDGYIPGEWGLPLQVLGGRIEPGRAARSLARRILGRPLDLSPAGLIRHAITHRNIRAHLFLGSHCSGDLRHPGGAFAWFPRESLGRMLTSSLYRKAIKAG